ncbi:MAG: hypothetical protein JKY37_28185, partial [Nannocystaceae bacterium]|nr:hypothetical protein [Nannocystaceae bacterium]
MVRFHGSLLVVTDVRKAAAIMVRSHGGPAVLRLETVDVPAPGPGEARVTHTAVGVNFIDTYHRSGLYPIPAP